MRAGQTSRLLRARHARAWSRVPVASAKVDEPSPVVALSLRRTPTEGGGGGGGQQALTETRVGMATEVSLVMEVPPYTLDGGAGRPPTQGGPQGGAGRGPPGPGARLEAPRPVN